MRLQRFLKNFSSLLLLVIIVSSCSGIKVEKEEVKSEKVKEVDEMNKKVIYLAGGCFWGVEEYFDRVYGVVDSESGYANGNTENPTYENVCYDKTGHAETVKITYDSSKVGLKTLLLHYFSIVDPTSLNKQGNDIGVQYRTGVYYTDEADKKVAEEELKKLEDRIGGEVKIELTKLDNYYKAENYHQDYLKKNPNGYCHIRLDNSTNLIIPTWDYKMKSEEELKKELTSVQYNVAFKNATEMAFSNDYHSNYEDGIYVDITSGMPLFSSTDKFNSGCGWPSFSKPIQEGLLEYLTDTKFNMVRTEVRTKHSNIHLGHVFDDGPKELTGKRYCINGAAIKFVPKADLVEKGYDYLLPLFKGE